MTASGSSGSRDPARVRSLFDRALTLPSDEHRAFVQRETADDPAARCCGWWRPQMYRHRTSRCSLVHP